MLYTSKFEYVNQIYSTIHTIHMYNFRKYALCNVQTSVTKDCWISHCNIASDVYKAANPPSSVVSLVSWWLSESVATPMDGYNDWPIKMMTTKPPQFMFQSHQPPTFLHTWHDWSMGYSLEIQHSNHRPSFARNSVQRQRLRFLWVCLSMPFLRH